MKNILRQIRSRLFKHYEMRIACLEAIAIQTQSSLHNAQQENEYLKGKINHTESFCNTTSHNLTHQVAELHQEIKRLKEQPYGNWSNSCTTSGDTNNELYVKRFSSTLRNT